jgi:hypothetical protein
VSDIAKPKLTHCCMCLSAGTRTGIIPFFCVFIAQSCIHVWSMTVLSAPLLITVSRKYRPLFSVDANISLTEPCERKHFESIDIYIYTGLNKPCLAAQGRETERYSDGSRGTLKQEWLCWRGPSAIYSTDQLALLYIDVFSWIRMAQFLVPSRNIQLQYILYADEEFFS